MGYYSSFVSEDLTAVLQQPNPYSQRRVRSMSRSSTKRRSPRYCGSRAASPYYRCQAPSFEEVLDRFSFTPLQSACCRLLAASHHLLGTARRVCLSFAVSEK